MILNINKPLFFTSFDVVAYIRRITNIKKVGHAGTLDPMATGVLVVAAGRDSTKQIRHIMSGQKEYVAEIILGVETNSLDRDGQVISTQPVPPLTKEQVDNAVQQFIGELQQIPPMFSAIHHQGARLYKLAREGQVIDLPPRHVTVDEIEVLSYPKNCGKGDVTALGCETTITTTANNQPQRLTIRVYCQSGVYVRSLARDIGQTLGTVAFLSSLVRTQVGEYRIEDSLSLEEFYKIQAKPPNRSI